jgi:molecular chaperone GrpE
MTDAPTPTDGVEDEVQEGAAEEVAPSEDVSPPSLEDILTDLETVTAQRDEYLALAQARQAEFENYRKRVMKQHTDDVARATGRLVEQLLPVLDAFDDGLRHGVDGLGPMRAQLLGSLEKQGLERLDPTEQPFDPNEHDAVAHEPGEGGEHVVAETLRAGYRWNGSLLRAAMVKVRD